MKHTISSLIPPIRYQCPINTCDWERNGPIAPEDPTKWPEAPNITMPDMAKQMARHVTAMTDAALQEHLETHTMLEWLQENARLRQKVADVERERDRAEERLEEAALELARERNEITEGLHEWAEQEA